MTPDFFLALNFVRNSDFRLWLSHVNLWIIWRESQVHLCFDVSSSHVFSGVCLGIRGNAASCDSKLELVQTQHTLQAESRQIPVEKSTPWSELCEETTCRIRDLEPCRACGISAYPAKWTHSPVLLFWIEFFFHELCIWGKLLHVM